MKIGKWFSLRGPGFVRRRAAVLLTRYGISPASVKSRIEKTITNLTLHGCAPTLLIPASLVERYPKFIRQLQDKGVKLGAHSYNHIDLNAIPLTLAFEQLIRAAQAFEYHGIKLHGFRCPYLSLPEALLDKLPKGLYRYSSNIAVEWDITPIRNNRYSEIVFETINKFYQPKKSHEFVCVPWMNSMIIEIPVCVPDDLQLHEGLGFCPERIASIGGQILDQIYTRGELFTLIFHSELADYCGPAFVALLRKARGRRPSVWIARLRDISDWWQEKFRFRGEISYISTGLRISFICSTRTTILAKGLESSGLEEWDGTYFRLNTRTIDVPATPRPFVGIAPSLLEDTASFLINQGYILDTSDKASQCSVYLDDGILARTKTQ